MIKLQVIQKPSYSHQFYLPFQLYLLTKKKIKFSPQMLDSPVTLTGEIIKTVGEQQGIASGDGNLHPPCVGYCF